MYGYIPHTLSRETWTWSLTWEHNHHKERNTKVYIMDSRAFPYRSASLYHLFTSCRVCCGTGSAFMLRLLSCVCILGPDAWDSPRSSFLTHVKQYVQAVSATQVAATGEMFFYRRAPCFMSRRLLTLWRLASVVARYPNTCLRGFCPDDQ